MELRLAVKNRKWKRVVEIYIDDPETQESRINRWGDTALHAAIETEGTGTVKRLIRAIKSHRPGGEEALHILSLKNNRGNTPLHCAAARGSDVIKLFHKSLIGVRNDNGETPLFLAALHGHREAFLVLHRAAGEDSPLYWRRNDGDTMLHCTIRREYFGYYVVCDPSSSSSSNHKNTCTHHHKVIYAEEPNPPTDDDRDRGEESTIDLEDSEMTMDEEQPTNKSVTEEEVIRTFEAVFRFPSSTYPTSY
ncbi:ankyrin repeat domain-containing protein 27-like [Neltuma alba]|uniref:ankyrin repeat domain-containing protein 27-like n=1 Tax=Neltuma alba TaxID=207710 RepID=UPI0010A2B5ED|nr:ankyrin repeat domain-containing protein 27-like [Prosopis alba]